MAIPPSPIQILYNRRGVVTVLWERNVTGDGTVRNWNLYWSPRLSGTYTKVQSDPIPNAQGYGRRYVRYDITRADLGIENDANFFLRLTSNDFSAVESAQVPTETKIVYQDGVTLTSRNQYLETDNQLSGATDIDYITPDAFDGYLDKVIITRDTTDPIDIQVSLVPAGEDPNAGGFDVNREIIFDIEEGYTLKTYYLRMDQLIPDIDLYQVRVKTTGVSGGSLRMLVGRRRFYIYSSAAV